VVAATTGDREAGWREAYTRVRKNPLTPVDRTNRARLRAMGFDDLDPGVEWLDLGAGDGNLSATLLDLGVRRLTALEVQADLATRVPRGAAVVVGDVRALPLAGGWVSVAVVMDVLHHVPTDDLDVVLGELARVLRPGGHLLVCEPAPTVVRAVLTVLLGSPLASLTAFSRDKRRMVELEADTLVPWLRGESDFAGRAASAGFVLERTTRRPLHTLRRFRFRP